MKLPYRSKTSASGVVNYELVDAAIILEFRHGRFRYVYDNSSPGPAHVAAMIECAQAGRGLSTYISQHVQENYARRLPLPPPGESERRPAVLSS